MFHHVAKGIPECWAERASDNENGEKVRMVLKIKHVISMHIVVSLQIKNIEIYMRRGEDNGEGLKAI